MNSDVRWLNFCLKYPIIAQTLADLLIYFFGEDVVMSALIINFCSFACLCNYGTSSFLELMVTDSIFCRTVWMSSLYQPFLHKIDNFSIRIQGFAQTYFFIKHWGRKQCWSLFHAHFSIKCICDCLFYAVRLHLDYCLLLNLVYITRKLECSQESMDWYWFAKSIVLRFHLQLDLFVKLGHVARIRFLSMEQKLRSGMSNSRPHQYNILR